MKKRTFSEPGPDHPPYPTQAEAIKRVADAYNGTRLTPFV
jgi:hypothetical protein